MDTLSEILRSVRLKGGVFLDGRFTSPWSVTSEITAEDMRTYMPEPEDLAKLRKAIAASSGKKFQAVEAALRKGKLALGDSDQLSRVPKGFEKLKDGPLDGAIRLKSFIVEEKLPQKLIGTPRLADAIFDFTRRGLPLLKFGWAALD